MRRLSLSSSINRENLRNIMKKTLKLTFETEKDTSQDSNSWLPEKIAEVANQRLTETGLEKYADINRKFESKYDVKEILGEGNSGIVKKCVDKISQEIYAVKIIAPSLVLPFFQPSSVVPPANYWN